jgi:hypothetical protein
MSGCSVDLFSSDRSDPEILGQTEYRRVRPQCSGVKLDGARFDGATFGALVRCFNANGSVPEISALVAEANPKTLDHTARVIDVGFLSDRRSLVESRAIIDRLSRTDEWTRAIGSFRYFLSDAERTRAAIRLFSLSDRSKPVLDAFRSMDPKESMRAFEILARIVNSPAFHSLQKGVLEHPLPRATREKWITVLSDFLNAKSARRSARSLFSDLVSGKAAGVWRYALGEDPQGFSDAAPIGVSVARFRYFLEDLGANDGRRLRGLSRVHQGFNQPIECWGKGKVFAEPWKNLADELRSHGGERFLPFVVRFASLTAIGVKDLCRVPSQFYDEYPRSLEIIGGRSGEAYVEILERVMSAGMGESAGYFVGEWGESLAEILSVLKDEPWFGDLLLVIAELDESDRDALARWFGTLLPKIENWDSMARDWDRVSVDSFFADLGSVLSGEAAGLGRLFQTVVALFEASQAHPWFEAWQRIVLLSSTESLEPLTKLEGFPEAITALDRMAEDGRLAAMLGDVLGVVGGAAAGELRPEVARVEMSVRRADRHRLTSRTLPSEIPSQNLLDASLAACARLDLRKRPAEQWSDFSACAGLENSSSASTGWAAIFSPRPGTSESYFDRFVKGWVRLPFSDEAKRGVLFALSDEGDGPVLEPRAMRDSLRKLYAWIGLKKDGQPSLLSAGLGLLARIRTELRVGEKEWQSAFARVDDLVRSVEFASLANALLRIQSFSDDRVLSDVGHPFDGTAVFARVADFECVRDPQVARVRTEEIATEFRTAVRGWDWKEGRLPDYWERTELELRARPLVRSLESAKLRANVYDFVRSVDGADFARWFVERANDGKPVVLLDPKTRGLRVRWMSSLDRLESVLVHSDFQHILPGNFGLKFMARFAEAWGDEPRAKWPKEIQARYRGRRRPPTLEEAYDEVERFLRGFEALGGMPHAPECASMPGPASGVDLRMARISAPEMVIPFELKAKGFNLRQTLAVIRENLPGSGDRSADGMRLLRDLFWAIYSSAPAGERSASDLERNPLRVLQHLGHVGGVRQLSRGFQSIRTEAESQALVDAWESLRTIVAEPAFDRVVVKFLTESFVSKWMGRAYRVGSPFTLESFAVGVLNALTYDRAAGFLASGVRITDRAVTTSVPSELALDLIEWVAEGEVRTLRTYRSANRTDAARLAMVDRFFKQKIEPIFNSLPWTGIVEVIEKDRKFRGALFSALRFRRQSPVESSRGKEAASAGGGPFLSESRPALRALTGLWCRENAGAFLDELAQRPDESVLIIDGLFQAVDSGGFEDFLEAILRQLPH